MRKKTALLTVWLMLVAGYVIVSQASSPAAPLPAFSGFSTGSNLHADVLRVSDVQEIADGQIGFSGAAVDSTSFEAAGIHNEMNFAVVPTAGAPDAGVDSADKESYGKGSGLEVGLGTPLPNDDANQVVPGGIAEAGAQPTERSDAEPVLSATDTGLVETELLEIVEANPLLYLLAAQGRARARFDETACLTDGNLSFGEGQTAKAQLVDTSADDTTPDLDAPLVNASSDFFGSQRGVNNTKSFSYLVPNGDGTFGLATETHMTFAPIGLLQTDPAEAPPIFIEILGEWIFKAVATGKTGGAEVTYEVAGLNDDPDTTVVRIYLGEPSSAITPTIDIHRHQLFTDTGINIDIPPGPGGPKLLSLTLGEDIRAISAPNVLPDPASDPTETGDGTHASGAADFIRIAVLNPDSSVPDGPEVANLRVGHFEAEALVPNGGIVCPTPPPSTTTSAGPTTSTTAGATTTTTTGGTTTTTTGTDPTTTTTVAGSTTTSSSSSSTSSTSSSTTSTTIATVVAGQTFTRGASPPAQPVTAQPRFTG